MDANSTPATDRFASACAEIARGWMEQDPTLTPQQAISAAIGWLGRRAQVDRPELLAKIGREQGWV